MMRRGALFFLATLLPLTAADRLHVSIQWEWIRLPHATANELIHRHLKHSRDSGALRDAVGARVRQKSAVRIDLQGIAVEEGSEVKLDTVVEKFYPTEFDPPQISQTLTLQGPSPLRVETTPAVSRSFTPRKLGRMAQIEAELTDDEQLVDVRFHPAWTEHLGDLSYGIGISEVKLPLFFNAECETRLLMTSGIWQLAGVFTPPPEPAKDVSPELASLPDDRVLLFVKASAPGLPAKAPKQNPDDPDQVSLFAEWIETDLTTVAELLTEHPDCSSASALRAAIGGELAAGRARLVETTVVPCRSGDRAKILSVREVPWPTVFNAPQVPQTLTLKGPPPAAPAAPGAFAPWVVPAMPGSFTFSNTGLTMEVECELTDGKGRAILTIAPQICVYAGRENFGLGPAMGSNPRFQRLESLTSASLVPGTPALVTTLDVPRTGDAPPGSGRSRKMLLFVTVIH